MTGQDDLGTWREAEEWVFYLLFQAVRRRDAAFARLLAPLGLDLGKWRILSVVRRMVGCTMNELAELTTIDRTTLTRAADQLSAAGLIVRQGSERDRRQVCLFLTKAGEALVGAALSAMRDFNLQALEGVEDEELKVTKATLAKILHNLTGSPPKARALLDFARA
jgi:DNA-binding MarR family transcriptional regulator